MTAKHASALLLFFLVTAFHAPAQEEVDFEEISVFLTIRHIGTTEVPAYLKGERLFLPVTDVFSFLRIQNTPTAGFDSVSGFFLNQDSRFLIDRLNNRIRYQDKVFDLKEGDLIRTESNLYLSSEYFGEIFGLNCNFNFGNMTVNLSTQFELPVIREMKRTMARSNLSKIRGEIKPDTVIRRNYPLFHFGAADWSIAANEVFNDRSDVRINLAAGALVFGGEATLNLNYGTAQPLDRRQQNYSWHFANNDFKAFKQVYIGKVPIQSNITVNAPVVGAQISNTPTTFQRSFCSYTLHDYTEPGWVVELYVNYVLVDYVTADASGFYSFDVPLVYGNSVVKLRFYGPWGEERTREQTIRVPFNFLKPGKFEYTLNGGIMENSTASKYSKLNMNLGVSRRLTIGAGFEYLTSIKEKPLMPFANFSLRLFNTLLVSAEYTYGVKWKGIVSAKLPADISLELYYTNLDKNQKAVNANYLEERKAVFSMPIRKSYMNSMLRLTVDQFIMRRSQYLSAELMLSGHILGVSTNLTTSALFVKPSKPYILSTLSAGIKLPAKIVLTPQVSYVVNQSRFLTVKAEMEKRLFRNGTITLGYERNFANKSNTMQAGLRYDFRPVQTNVSIRRTDAVTSSLQFARGSFVYEGKGGKAKFSRNSSAGKGGIILITFLDLNDDGKYQEGEPRIPGVNFRINGGRMEKRRRDSTMRVSDLEPFTNYLIEMDKSGFENVAWQIAKPSISVTVNPNQFKLVHVPVRILGEVSGSVVLANDAELRGLGRVLVKILRSDSTLIATLLTEEDGYFSYFGLLPGSYLVRLDAAQLTKVGMAASETVIPFTIRSSMEGDITGGIRFVLRRISPVTKP